MDSITLKYGSGVGAYAKTFSVANANLLYVRGLDDVDELRFWPAIQNQLLDGSMVENVSKFGRTITVNFGVIPVKADRVWLAMWMIGTSKVLSVAAEEIPVVLGSLDGFANEWVDGFELAKSFTVVCKEVSVTSSQPASWGSLSKYAYNIPVTNDGTCGGITAPGINWTPVNPELTLEFWYRMNAVPVTWFAALVCFESGIQTFVDYASMCLGWSWNNGSAISTIPVVVGETHHYAFVLDTIDGSGFYITVYVDGVVAQARTVEGGSQPAFYTESPLDVGRQCNLNNITEPGYTYPAARPCLGDFDEVRVWNVARTQAQIQATRRLSITEPQDDLIACWGFDSLVADPIEGRSILDTSGGGHTMKNDGWPTSGVVGSVPGLF